MNLIPENAPLAVALKEAIHTGDIPALKRLLADHPGLAAARISEADERGVPVNGGMSRALLHVVTDWPGHFPNGAATVAALIEAGADLNWAGYDKLTPLDTARRSEADEVVDWLLGQGAKSAEELF